LPASPDKNSSSAIEDGLKSGDDVVEYPTKGDGKEMSMADTAIAVSKYHLFPSYCEMIFYKDLSLKWNYLLRSKPKL